MPLIGLKITSKKPKRKQKAAEWRLFVFGGIVGETNLYTRGDVMLKLRSLALLLLALIVFVGCSGSSNGGNSRVYAIKDPSVGEPVVVGMEVGNAVKELVPVDSSTLFNPPTVFFNFVPEKGSAYDGVNNAIITFIDSDYGETLVSIDVSNGKVSKFSDITYPGEGFVAIYATSSVLKALLQNTEGDLRLVTISLASKTEVGASMPIAIDVDAAATAGPPRHDNYIIDTAANKIFFLGDNGTQLHLFEIDLLTGLLTMVSTALPYDVIYSCLYNDGESVGVIVESGINDIKLLTINKSNGATSYVAIDTAGVKNPTDTISFPNDYLHAESTGVVYGSSIISSADLTSIIDNLFSFNKATKTLTILDGVVGCYYALVFAP